MSDREDPEKGYSMRSFREKLASLLAQKAQTGSHADEEDCAEAFDTPRRQAKGNEDSDVLPFKGERPLARNPDEAWDAIAEAQLFCPVPTKNASAGGSEGAAECIRIVCMSDTHGRHRDIAVPRGDVLIHAGDFTNTGEPEQVEDLSSFFQEQDTIQHVICIAGNHDLTFHPDHYAKVARRFHGRRPFSPERARSALKSCTYLEDSSTDIGGIRFYGSPWQPWFYDWAFNLERGADIRRKWELIPSSADVLVTHGPPLGRGDLCGHGGCAGCHDLLREVQDRVRPRLHVFGHIHEGRGVSFDGTTLFVNASNVTISYAAHNPCIVVDLPLDPSLPAAVVEPECSLSGPEVIEWLRSRGYAELVPFFLEANPSLKGKELIAFERDWFIDICNRLSLHDMKHREARRLLGKALMQLRAESY